jgi:hypothetical protein
MKVTEKTSGGLFCAGADKREWNASRVVQRR